MPDAPANFSAAAGVRSIAADWNAPANDGFAEVTAYRVRWRVSDDGSGTPGAWQDASGDDAECNDNDADNDAMCGVEVAASSTAYAISGLDAVSYDVAAAAVNSAGIGAWSDAQATPRKSSNANLSALHPSAGGLTPVFTAATLTYELFLLNAQATSITVTATLADTSARFTLQEDAETPVAGTSGAASSAINLVAGVGKLVRIAVTAEDGSTQKIYAIEVKRQGPPAAPLNPSASAAGRTITVRWEEPHDGFVNLGGYLVRWRRSDAGSGSPGPWQDANGEDAECNDNNAGNDALCGVEVAASSTAYTISGLDKASYDVAVAALNFHGPSAWSEAQAAPSGLDDATLSALAMSSGNLSPAFDAATTEYTAVVPNQDAEVGITATLNDEHASFTLQVDSGTPAAGASGVASAPTSIAVGASVTFKIAVTSDDGTAEKTYTVVATRPILPNAPANLKVTPGRAAFSLDWDEPAAVAGAPITGYRVRFTTVTPPTWNGNNGADGITTGSADATWNLTRNGTLWFAVASVSEAGQSEWSAAQGPVSTSSTNPDPPRNLSAVSANELQVRWQAPTDPDVQSYRVRWKADGVNTYTPELRVAATMTSIANLPSGKYDVQVAALEAGVDDAITSATLSSVWASATFDAAATDNADLRELSVVNAADQTALAPGFSFDRETLSYDLAAPTDVSRVTLTPATANSNARIRATAGTAAAAALASGAGISANLQKGIPFTFRFAVDSADRAVSKTYTVVITRVPDRLQIGDAPRHRYYTGAPQTVILPEASGGVPPYSYSLRASSVSGALPAQFSYDADTRALTVHFPDRLVSLFQQTLLYRVTDSAATMRQTEQVGYTIQVRNPVEFAGGAPAALTFQYNAAGSATLPEPREGYPPLSYALRGDTLPAGLQFNQTTRELAGTPAESGMYNLEYVAQDAERRGGGIARADIVLTVVPNKAAALSGLAVTPADQRLVLRWTAPTDADLGGGVLRDYRVRWAEGSGSTSWVDANGVSTGGTDAFYTISGLTNGTAYSVQVAAVNSAGTGAWSTSAEGTPQEVLAFATPQADLVFLADTQLASPVVLPAAEHGSTPYTYEVSGLPSGLAFDEETREISGTPAAGTDAQITYTVTDNAGDTAEQEFSIRTATFDLDLDTADGDAAAAATVRDGIITARYLLGSRGPSLIRRQSAGNFRDYESSLQDGVATNALDVDGDGDSDETDGFLIARYLFGLRGDELFAGFTVNDEAATAANIAALLPGG